MIYTASPFFSFSPKLSFLAATLSSVGLSPGIVDLFLAREISGVGYGGTIALMLIMTFARFGTVICSAPLSLVFGGLVNPPKDSSLLFETKALDACVVYLLPAAAPVSAPTSPKTDLFFPSIGKDGSDEMI